MQANYFVKAHGLGNEYVVIDSTLLTIPFTNDFVVRVCNIHYGLGTDGVLLKVPSDKADFGLRIFNPDGSEAEKSGNGLRIFSKYLYDYGFADGDTFSVETLGGVVRAEILEVKLGKAQTVRIDMGKAQFDTATIPALFDTPQVLNQRITVADKVFDVCCVSVGNPHCVVFVDQIDADVVKAYGPMIENHQLFPRRINVQFAKVLDRANIQVQIWERGAGYTMASGSSSCAVASVARMLGYVDEEVSIQMPGGVLDIEVDNLWNIKMTGPVREIASGVLSSELLEDCCL